MKTPRSAVAGLARQGTRSDKVRTVATVLLVRHGHTAAIGSRIVGRLPGIELTSKGRLQAERLVSRLSGRPLAAIYSSPLERAIESARPLAAARGMEIGSCAGLIEIDFGEWTGLTFDSLDRLPAWHRFNAERGSAPVPGGEGAVDVQRRAVHTIEAIAARHPGETVAAFSHGDVIRSILLYYTGKPLDRIEDFPIDPASVSALSLTPRGASVLYVNDPDPG